MGRWSNVVFKEALVRYSGRRQIRAGLGCIGGLDFGNQLLLAHAVRFRKQIAENTFILTRLSIPFCEIVCAFGW